MNELFRDSAQKELSTKDAICHKFYVAVHLPFHAVAEISPFFETIYTAYHSYTYHKITFERKNKEDDGTMLSATGIGSDQN